MTPDADRGEKLFHAHAPEELFDCTDDDLLDAMAHVRAETRAQWAADSDRETGGVARQNALQFEALYRVALEVLGDDE